MKESFAVLAPFRWQWPNYSSLPAQPVPPLKQTMEHFLRFARLMLSDKDYMETVELVKEFVKLNGVGETLQGLLENRAQYTENWMAEWWLNYTYLMSRDPLPINTSCCMSFPPRRFSTPQQQLDYAALLVEAVLNFKDSVDRKSLKGDTNGNVEFDMCQYDLLFGTSRIPGKERDTLRYSNSFQRPSDHIIVIRNGHLFSVPVFDTSLRPLSPNQICMQLRAVKEKSETVCEHPVGILTTEKRANWWRTRSILQKNKGNKWLLDVIECSLFVLCLDRSYSHSESQQNETEKVQQLLHGNGIRFNGGNRWFDKTLQFIVSEDGYSGLVFEHSPIEALPIVTLMETVMHYLGKWKKAIDSERGVKAPFRLNFTLNDEVKEAITVAGKNFELLINDFEVNAFSFNHFGKDILKAYKVSPDSFIQLALQLAYYRCHNEWAATYETGTMRRYKLGRTDNIRLPNNESVAFVLAMQDPKTSNSQKVNSLRQAVNAHKNYATAACSANGMDRHLVGLKWAALEEGMPVPKLFNSKAFGALMHYKLSTSQVPAKMDIITMYGCGYPDAYGFCYNPQERKINIVLSASNGFPGTSAVRLGEILERSLLDMRDVLASGYKAKL